MQEKTSDRSQGDCGLGIANAFETHMEGVRVGTEIERLARGQATTRAELTVQMLNPVIDEQLHCRDE